MEGSSNSKAEALPGVRKEAYMRTMLNYLDDIAEEDSVLYRTVHNSDGHPKQLLIVPSAMKGEVVKAAHNDFGHQGPERIKQVVQQWCWWPRMHAEVKH